MKYPPKQVGLRHIDWVGLILATELPTLSKAITMYLSRFMNKDQNVAWPSRARIEQELSISRGALNKHLDLLESEGWIKRKRGDSQNNTRYWISFPSIIEGVVHQMNQGSSLDELRSSPDELGVVHEVNTNRPLNSKYNNTSKSADSDKFDLFWENYPRKEGKKKAKQAFLNLSNKKQESAIKDVSARYRDTEKRFIPLPATYIHGERWDDEVTESVSNQYGRGGI